MRTLIVSITKNGVRLYSEIECQMPEGDCHGFFTDYEKCRFRACITVQENISFSKETGYITIPEGKYATYSMKGTLHSVFKSLIAFRHGWLNQSGYQIAEISGFELYMENPALNPDQNILRQVFIPVKPA